MSVSLAEAPQGLGRRFQLEVSECVETKTVTTTTRLTRKFPHVFVRDPTPLANLDSKEYPLAMKETPPELLQFQYNMMHEAPDADRFQQRTDSAHVAPPEPRLTAKPVSRARRARVPSPPPRCLPMQRPDEAGRRRCPPRALCPRDAAPGHRPSALPLAS